MKLCVALDLPSEKECLNLASALKGEDVWLKVGLRAYLRDSAAFVAKLKNMGFKVFLDLKIYDIPNTTADACEVMADTGADMINLHASAGRVAMNAVMERLANRNSRPLVLAVSALTSFDDVGFGEVYGEQKVADAVINMSRLAHECGLDGMVCSAYESLAIKDATSEDFITLTPGIRPFGESAGDQKRVANLDFAKSQKSDFIVVGRPIYAAPDPLAAAQKILANI